MQGGNVRFDLAARDVEEAIRQAILGCPDIPWECVVGVDWPPGVAQGPMPRATAYVSACQASQGKDEVQARNLEILVQSVERLSEENAALRRLLDQVDQRIGGESAG